MQISSNYTNDSRWFACSCRMQPERLTMRHKDFRARPIGAAAILGLCFSALVWAQAGTPAASSDTSLTVAGDVTRPLTLSPADLKAMPRTLGHRE